MKFHQLRIGERFRYREQTLRKVSPLHGVAETADDGPRQMVPRSAEVEVIDQQGAPVARALPDTLRRADVAAALARLTDALEQALGQTAPTLSADQQGQLLAALHQARDEMLTTLASAGK